jgi:hypothetical protein
MITDYFTNRLQNLGSSLDEIVERVADGASQEWVLLRLGVLRGIIHRDIAEYQSLIRKQEKSLADR